MSNRQELMACLLRIQIWPACSQAVEKPRSGVFKQYNQYVLAENSVAEVMMRLVHNEESRE